MTLSEALVNTFEVVCQATTRPTLTNVPLRSCVVDATRKTTRNLPLGIFLLTRIALAYPMEEKHSSLPNVVVVLAGR